MITFDQMVQKFGKTGAIQRAVNCRKNERTGAEKDRGIRGRVRYRRCAHGVWTINDYKQENCSECQNVSRVTKSREFSPYFNIGLGCWVESRSEERREAKRLNLVEAG